MSKEPRPLPPVAPCPHNSNRRACQQCNPSSPPPPPKKVSGRITRCTTHSHACPCREYRMAKMEAAMREVEQIAVSSQSWRDGKEELDKIKWICREALKQP